MKLKNQRHELFAQGVAAGLSAAEAYEKAGYKPHRQAASRLLSNVDVAARIEELTQKVAETVQERTAISKEWVVEKLRAVAERCMQEEPVLINGQETGEYTFNASGANRALELIGKEYGMFVEKKEVDQRNFFITDEVMTDDDWVKKFVAEGDDRRSSTTH